MALLLIKNIVFLIVRNGIIWYNNHGFKTMIPEYTSCQEGCSGIPFFTVLMTVYRVNQRQATRSLYCHLKLASTRRNQNDQKTYGELFFMFCDDIQDMDLTSSLQSLMALFVEHILTLSADITSIIKCKVSEWIASQAAFIQALFRDISWESWVC